MPITSNKQETTLSYRLDARGLKDLRKEIGKTFDRRQVSDMNAALKGLKSSLKDVAAEQIRLTKALDGVADGTDAYKALESQLDRTEQRTRRLTSAIGAMNNALKEPHDPKRGAFTQGLLQGISPAVGQFIQRDKGMGRQFAGQTIGSWARGATTGMVGGQGPLTSLLGNIPLIGGAAQMAEQQAGAAVSFQRARMEALPFLGGFGLKRGRSITEEVAGTTASPSDIFDVARTKDEAAADARRRAAAGRIAQRGMPGIVGPIPDTKAEAIAKEGAQSAIDNQNRMRRGGDMRKGGTAATTRTRRMRGELDPFLEAGGAAFLTKQESMEAAGQFGRTVGGGRKDAGAFGQVEAARVLFGVGRETGGGLFRQARPGRGGTDRQGVDLLAESIGDALAQNLEGSEIGEYLDQLVSLQEQAAQQGVKIDAGSFGAMAGALSKGFGLLGPQAGRVAGEFAGFGQRVATGGAKGPMDITLLRSLGFKPEEGGNSYIDALMKAEKIGEGGMDANTLFSLIQSLTAGEDDPKRAGLSLQRALGSAGVRLGVGQAVGVAQAAQGGRAGFEARLATLSGAEVAQGQVKFATDLKEGLRDSTVREWGVNIQKQINIENQLLATGGKVVDEVQKMQASAAKLADSVGVLADNKVIEKVTDGIVTLSAGIGTIVEAINRWSNGVPLP